MREAMGFVEIKGQPQDIWQQLMDFQRYQQWTSAMTFLNRSKRILGCFGVSVLLGKLKVRLPFVLGKMQHGQEFVLRSPFWINLLLDYSIYFNLKRVDSEFTVVSINVRVFGFLSYMLWPSILDDHLKPAIDKFGLDLKSQCLS